MNLLIIDDDKDLLKLLKLTFEKEYNVVICNSALKLRPSDLCKYDLIILDIMMEEMSGFEFLTKYRNMIDIPIILLTAKDFEKDKVVIDEDIIKNTQNKIETRIYMGEKFGNEKN